MTTDADHKFELSLQLDDLETALEIARSVPELEAEMKWKSLGDRALAVWRFDLARECFEKAGDLSALMLLLLAIGDRDGLQGLAAKAGMCLISVDGSWELTSFPCMQNKMAKITLHLLHYSSLATLRPVLISW